MENPFSSLSIHPPMKSFVNTILRFKLFALVAVCTVLFLVNSPFLGSENYEEQKEACDVSKDDNTFEAGESLTYKVNYKWSFINMTAGSANFKLHDSEYKGTPAYHVKCKGRTASAFNWFYEVDDYYETYIDKSSMKPVKFSLDISEGKYKEQTQYEFFHNQNTANVNFRIKQGKVKMKNQDVSISECTQDIVSILYYCRSMDFSQFNVGETVNLELFTSGKIKKVFFRYMGKEVVKTKIGKIRCIKLSPYLLESDTFGEGGEDKMMVYATDDGNKLPVLVESPVTIGKVRVHLTDYSGLKHPMTARVN